MEGVEALRDRRAGAYHLHWVASFFELADKKLGIVIRAHSTGLASEFPIVNPPPTP